MSRLSDDEFQNAVWLLDRFEGEFLRKVCDVVMPIVEEIFYGCVDLNTRYLIETVELDQIMHYAKDSSSLLQLFSRNLAPNK